MEKNHSINLWSASGRKIIKPNVRRERKTEGSSNRGVKEPEEIEINNLKHPAGGGISPLIIGQM